MMLKHTLIIFVFAAILAGCGVRTEGSAGAPTATSQAPAATAGPASPTTGSTGVAPTATIVDAQPQPPTFAAAPQQGGPGTVVALHGWNFAPNTPVVVRLGLPQPTGDALASAVPDAGGQWRAELTLPDRLPSGELITRPDIYLVIMDEANRALASAPFAFTPAQPQQPTPTIRDAQPQPAADPVDAVRQFLTAAKADRSGKSASFYLGGPLRDRVQSGQDDVGVILQEQNPFQSFTIDGVIATDTQNTYVQATLLYGSAASGGSQRIFTVSDREERSWRVFKISLPPDTGDPTPGPDWPGSEWLVAAKSDYSGDGVEETVYYRPVNVTPRDRFLDEHLNSQAVVATEIMIVQRSAHGITFLLVIDGVSARAPDHVLAPFRSTASPEGSAAFLFALDPGSSILVNALPLKADGTAYTQMVVINWNQAEGGYRLVPLPEG